MREQKILLVKLKNGKKLVITSANITSVEELDKESCRVYYADKYIDIQRSVEWMMKHLIKDYEESDAFEL